MPKKERWRALVKSNYQKPYTDAEIKYLLSLHNGVTEAELLAAIKTDEADTEFWINDIYQVQLKRLHGRDGKIGMIHLNIRRRDGRPIFRDWRHFQWIKNQLVGDECEGVELYPAESRLQDTSNKYHLWVYTDPTYRIPLGMDNRDVADDDGARKPGFRQRKL